MFSKLDDSRSLPKVMSRGGRLDCSSRQKLQPFIDGVRRARIVSLASSGNDEEAAYPAAHQSPEESLNTAEREEQLHRAWLKLDRNHRALLALQAEGYSVQEISEITGVDDEALNARLYRARRNLVRHLAAEHETAPRIRMEIAK